MTKRCEHCDDTGWVCEVHTDRPWDGAPSERACNCGALAMLCEACNPGGGPDEPPAAWEAEITATLDRDRARRTRRRAIETIRRDRRSGGGS